MPFIGKTYRQAIALERPKLFDESLIQFFRPFAR